eukprot:TRINITY_DN3991_c4_g1_i1.p1 TRINITY_DN3991_c4_g1~~TRINITY_DN3991_c4_g1_i1.p1  ORF type:complete len:440 (+),score=118.71 TRINITY_DN3991_c4_g1_i1:94-1320(+)
MPARRSSAHTATLPPAPLLSVLPADVQSACLTFLSDVVLSDVVSQVSRGLRAESASVLHKRMQRRTAELARVQLPTPPESLIAAVEAAEQVVVMRAAAVAHASQSSVRVALILGELLSDANPPVGVVSLLQAAGVCRYGMPDRRSLKWLCRLLAAFDSSQAAATGPPPLRAAAAAKSRAYSGLMLTGRRGVSQCLFAAMLNEDELKHRLRRLPVCHQEQARDVLRALVPPADAGTDLSCYVWWMKHYQLHTYVQPFRKHVYRPAECAAALRRLLSTPELSSSLSLRDELLQWEPTCSEGDEPIPESDLQLLRRTAAVAAVALHAWVQAFADFLDAVAKLPDAATHVAMVAEAHMLQHGYARMERQVKLEQAAAPAAAAADPGEGVRARRMSGARSGRSRMRSHYSRLG